MLRTPRGATPADRSPPRDLRLRYKVRIQDFRVQFEPVSSHLEERFAFRHAINRRRIQGLLTVTS